MAEETATRTAHTPGEWKTRSLTGAASDGLSVYTDARPIARTYALDYSPKDEDWAQVRLEEQANARLIAAAPDLLAACTEMLGEFTDFISDEAMSQGRLALVKRARAAIAKATGASS